MSFKSQAQQKWANSPEGIKALGGKDKVHEWSEASTHLSLPDRVKSPSKEKKKEPTGFGKFGKFGKYGK